MPFDCYDGEILVVAGIAYQAASICILASSQLWIPIHCAR